ncbi:MAG: translation elongation factor-like protein [Actinobacteria bacterium]|jgi:putative protease|nr:MAG: translation elongation factor-like protein [Actinomycetota bacterium]
MAEEEIGRVSHYYGKIGVAAIELDGGGLKVGDTIRILGHTTDLTTSVESLQIEHESVQEALQGQAVGVRVPGHVREHDRVLKVLP